MLLYVHFSIAIILMGKRELIALLNLSSWCLVMVERLFLAVQRGCLQFVIVVFPDHTHLLFLTLTQSQLVHNAYIILEGVNNPYALSQIKPPRTSTDPSLLYLETIRMLGSFCLMQENYVAHNFVLTYITHKRSSMLVNLC